MTDYVILRLIENPEDVPGQWQQYAGLIEASSPARALRIANHGTGTFVAVPKRRFLRVHGSHPGSMHGAV